MKLSMMPLAAALVAISVGAFAGSPAPHPDELVGTSIGTSFLLDPTFGDAGSVRMSFDGVSSYPPIRIIKDTTGYWLLGSHLAFIGSSYAQPVIVRLDAAGNPDPAFGDGGSLIALTDLAVSDMALGDDGRFYASGIRYEPNDAAVAAVACIEADGTGCPDFDPDAGALSVRVDGFDMRQLPRLLFRDGSLFIVGAAALSSSGNIDTVIIAKLDADTAAPDAGFGDGSPAPGEAIFELDQYPGGSITTDAAVFDGARMLVGGAAQSTQEGGAVGYVLALDTGSGAADTGFGNGGLAPLAFGSGPDRVQTKALALRADGRIAVAGDADLGAGPTRELMLAELERDGQLAADFAGGGLTHLAVGHRTAVNDLALRVDGSLVVAMTASGLLPDGESDSMQQALAEFDAGGSGPVSTASIEFDGDAPPTSSYSYACALHVDDAGRAVLAGAHFYGIIGDTIISVGIEMTATRFVTDAIYANGFE